MSRLPLSVLVTTLDEAQNLPDCLESVRWADDILVVDSGSRDGTQRIALAAGARLLEHPYESAARQKNWALGHLRHPWVLILDADERVSPELAAEVRAVVSADGPQDGFFLHRRSYFLGHEIRHCGWDSDQVLRLFRANRGRYDDRMVHEKLVLTGTSARLRGRLDHYTYRSFADYLERLERYSARGAADLRRAGRARSVASLWLRPPARFVRMYVLQRGFQDGIYGLFVCTLAAVSVWLKHARTWERDAPTAGAAAPPQPGESVAARAPAAVTAQEAAP